MTDLTAPWLSSAWAVLSEYQSQQRVPHGLLIQGPQGIGKSRIAEKFASALLCSHLTAEGESCKECHSCNLFLAGNHPDYFVLEAENQGKTISVDQVRSLTGRLALKPQYGQYRVVIIRDAHRMNVAAVNALLKTLEEPTERTSMILLTHAPVQLPATILSRCHRIKMNSPAGEDAIEWLSQQYKDTESQISVALNAANGSPYLALEYLEKGWSENYSTIIVDLAAVFFGKKHYPIVAAEWEKSGIPEQILNWLIQIVIDLIQLLESNLISSNKAKTYEKLTLVVKQCDRKKLYFYLDFLIQRKMLLLTQINQQLMFEELLIHWYGLKQSH